MVMVAVSMFATAKKVKFAVDLTGFEVSPNGVHVTGDFQTVAGFPGGDWTPNTTKLIQEGSTSIYSRVVDVPAFQKYEYRFVNGDQFYESEFVPVESRVGYDFNDNRWIYVDSIANDTTYVGAIVFGGNAPAGKYLVRFLVNMQLSPSIPPSGVHVAGSFQAWNPATIRLYSFGEGVYEIIQYLPAGTYQYKFYNGNTPASTEIVPQACAISNNRQIIVSEDIILGTVCFSRCADCSALGIPDRPTELNILISPNPASDYLDVSLPASGVFTIAIYDFTGKEMVRKTELTNPSNRIDLSNYKSGMYFMIVMQANKTAVRKFAKM